MPVSKTHRKKKKTQTRPSDKNKTYTKTDSFGRTCLYDAKHRFIKFIPDVEFDEEKILKNKFKNP